MNMLQFGKNITGFNDSLSKITPIEIYQLIKNPPFDILSQINQLRTLITIDEKKYRQLKTILPYITCGIFSPPFRKTENFAAINHFVIDLDHLNEKDINVNDLKTKLMGDESIEMMFISPGNQGLKIMFQLEEKCYDHAKYSLFYKLFLKNFSDRYGLSQVMDKRTSDVTRACFVSFDPAIWYNSNCLTVNMQAYINFENYNEVKEANEMINAIEKETSTELTIVPKDEISPDIFCEIRKKLNPNTRVKPEKNIYVPEELESMLEKIKNQITELGILLKNVENINYGKKIVFEIQGKWAELNLFFGKRGYTVVKTPKRGSDSELGRICDRIVREIIYN